MWQPLFKQKIAGKLAQLIGLRDEDMVINTMITTYNTAVIDAASEVLENETVGHKRCSRPL